MSKQINKLTEGLINPCFYKNMFGMPQKGAHAYRLFGVAIVDVVLTVVVGYLVAIYFEWPPIWTIFGFFLLGVFFHRLFCVRTTVDKLLFSVPRDNIGS